MHPNSIEAYRAIEKKLGPKQKKVYDCIKSYSGGISRQRIAIRLGVPINQVTGRVRELLDLGAIIESGTERVGGRSRSLLIATRGEMAA